jgi:hypothetical protein
MKSEKSVYRPRKFEKVLEFAGINSNFVCSPVMAEEFHIRFENEQDATQAEEKLKALQVLTVQGGRPMMRLKRNGKDIYAGCGIFEKIVSDATLRNASSGKSIPFFKIFYQIEEIKSGMHHPDRVLWIRNPSCEHSIHQEKVSLLSIAPTVLEILGIKKLDSMKGTSLVEKHEQILCYS